MCKALRRSAVRCSALRCSAVRCCTVRYSAVYSGEWQYTKMIFVKGWISAGKSLQPYNQWLQESYPKVCEASEGRGWHSLIGEAKLGNGKVRKILKSKESCTPYSQSASSRQPVWWEKKEKKACTVRESKESIPNSHKGFGPDSLFGEKVSN